MERNGFAELLDGTNVDDLKYHRPGLRAIHELGVNTPLLEAGLNKDEIRFLAKELGLPNFDKPSNSCLATRIAPNQTITLDLLKCINRAETFLEDRGLNGCRVQPRGKMIIIDLRANNPEIIVSKEIRSEINIYFKSLGFDTVLVDLETKPFV